MSTLDHTEDSSGDLRLCFASLLRDHVACRPAEIAAAVEAAGAAGYTGLSLFAAHATYAVEPLPEPPAHTLTALTTTLRAGHARSAELLQAGRLESFADGLSASGLRVDVLEFLSAWASGDLAATEAETGALSRVARRFGATRLLAVCVDPSVLLEDAARGLARAADIAAAEGLRVIVEFTPLFAIRDLATALALIEEADRENIGLVVDTFHATTSGCAPADLLALPAGLVDLVQVSAARPQDAGLAAANFARGMPSPDDEELVGLLHALTSTGAHPIFAPEVFNGPLLDELGVTELARRMAVTTRAALEAAR